MLKKVWNSNFTELELHPYPNIAKETRVKE